MRVLYTAAKLALMTGLAGIAGLAFAATPYPAGAPYGHPLYTPFPPQPQFQAPPPRMNPMPPQPQFQAPPPRMNPMPPQPQFQAPPPRMQPMPPQPQFQAPPPRMQPMPPQPQFQAPPASSPAAPGTETSAPYAGYPYHAWRDRNDDGPFDWGPWSDGDGEWGVNDWFGDWGSLFDGTGRLEMDFEMDMNMDFDADANANADTDTEFRGDSYYHGYDGYGPYGSGLYPLYPPAPMLAPSPVPYAPPPGSLQSTDDQPPSIQGENTAPENSAN
ncbi:MAG: hypothetical protein P8Z33_04270 [Gammaproteobacteria bacterium]|jgi:hypothetical protein